MTPQEAADAADRMVDALRAARDGILGLPDPWIPKLRHALSELPLGGYAEWSVEVDHSVTLYMQDGRIGYDCRVWHSGGVQQRAGLLTWPTWLPWPAWLGAPQTPASPSPLPPYQPQVSCPSCGQLGAYVGLFQVECPNPRCIHSGTTG